MLRRTVNPGEGSGPASPTPTIPGGITPELRELTRKIVREGRDAITRRGEGNRTTPAEELRRHRQSGGQ